MWVFSAKNIEEHLLDDFGEAAFIKGYKIFY
jgi:hypothetical protein